MSVLLNVQHKEKNDNEAMIASILVTNPDPIVSKKNACQIRKKNPKNTEKPRDDKIRVVFILFPFLG